MKVNEFAKMITEYEGKKKQVNIAQVMEIMKVINNRTHGLLYFIIKNWL